ncbi:hypothetical protein FH609_006225 [Streptomyces sp. 3MP-14]|uniref:Uncharacterized protein n=1 Tax=Streptomyces mimosae TaxID=2586635 RepID=A0A5N6AMK5_9ACTN|nr:MULTISPECIES: hypothetical protein [Streptomyces]KAB8169864.1 hypothetical protein FH607_003905 [Streptomyces mimosae]KAB8178612.1 hypothetical protein FH609_006225 [Streptomyces sp. 3MP-14]
MAHTRGRGQPLAILLAAVLLGLGLWLVSTGINLMDEFEPNSCDPRVSECIALDGSTPQDAVARQRDDHEMNALLLMALGGLLLLSSLVILGGLAVDAARAARHRRRPRRRPGRPPSRLG